MKQVLGKAKLPGEGESHDGEKVRIGLRFAPEACNALLKTSEVRLDVKRR